MTDKILMCPPEYFGIKYEINPWMNVNIQAQQALAQKQWENLYNLLINELKADIRLVEPQGDVPDMVFTANAAVMYGDRAVISRFKHPQRQPEEKYFKEWFEQNSYETTTLGEGMSFEGAGDALYLGDVLYAGYVPRTDISSHTFISELLGIPVISLELASNRFYHLDTCFCPLEGGFLIYYPPAFDYYANRVIENSVPPEKRIIVSDEEAAAFACNAVNIGDAVVTNLTTERFGKVLREKGFRHFQTDLGEFMKAGGAAKCLTLKV